MQRALKPPKLLTQLIVREEPQHKMQPNPSAMDILHHDAITVWRAYDLKGSRCSDARFSYSTVHVINRLGVFLGC